MVTSNQQECLSCINSTLNPSITINSNGLCNVCENYYMHVNKARFEQEIGFLKTFIQNKKYDVMVGISGGKDSTATLVTTCDFGFTPLAFTFDIGYTTPDIFPRATSIAQRLGVDHEIIDVKEYVQESDIESFQRIADLYDEEENDGLAHKFRRLYAEGRNYYSAKCNRVFAYVRPCQLCRKIAIRAYYGEAVKRGINVVVLGMNEWAGLSNGSYAAVRKLFPFPNKPPVYIFHLPFLLQRRSSDTEHILLRIGWKRPEKEELIDSNSSTCLLARACESKAERMLGFHLDSTRLAREVTVGFITKQQAKDALSRTRESCKSVRQVLKDAGLI